MELFEMCISDVCVKYTEKEDIDYKAINKSLTSGKQRCTIDDAAASISEGYSFSPATFKGEKRNKNNVEQMQLFALDFDSDKESGSDRCSLEYGDALQRAKRFSLPVVLSYETKSSNDYSRYRLLFLYNEPVYDKRYMELICRLLLIVFPEADSTSSDISKFYLPGKNVIKLSEDYFYLDMLIIAARTFTEENFKNTWKNRIHHLQNKTGIVCVGNDIYISPKPAEIVRSGSVAINTYMVLEPEWTENEKTPANNRENRKAYIYFSDNREKIRIDSEPVKRSQFYQKDIPYDDCVKRCRLFAEFVSGERRLEHHEWFGLATNLIYKNRGQTEFRNTLEAYPDLYDDIGCKLEQVRYAVKNGYLPTRCENYCPYADECSHKTNALLTMKKDYSEFERISPNTHYIELSELRRQLNEAVLSAVTGNIKNTVIKTQTGAGKTYAALRAIQSSKDRVIMAFSNTELMNEVFFNAANMGIEAVRTPTVDEIYQFLSPEECDIVQSMYNSGTGEMVNEYLREIGRDNDKVRVFLKSLEKAVRHKGHIFTTHARLLTLDSEMLEDSTVIIDEDILPLMLSVREASLDDLRRFHNALIHSGSIEAADKLEYMLAACKGKSRYFYSKTINVLRNDMRFFADLISDIGGDIFTCVAGALVSSYFYYSSTKKSVSFIVRHQLDQSYKRCIMLSATADRCIHTRLFENCNFAELPQAKYQGELIQYHDKTYSRFYFQQEPEALLQELTDKHPDCNFITFKKYIQHLKINKSQIMYFGKSVGVNCFSGHDLVVVGTPHKPEYAYHLAAEALGIDNKEDSPALRKIEANGFRFHIMTFKTAGMQEIQRYFIESDLEQAIGRARLLNEKCTVYVYSRYPAKQCLLAEEAELTSGKQTG